MKFNFNPGSRVANYATGVVLLIVAAAIPGLKNTVIDNRLERWADPSGESAQIYDGFQDTFGEDEFAVIAYKGDNLFDETALDVQLDVLEAIEALPMVSRVVSIPSVYRDNFGAEDPDELKRDVLATPFYRGFLISDSGDMAAYFILVAPTAEPDARTQLAQQLREAARPLETLGFEVYQAGSPILIAALDDTSLKSARFVFPLALAVSILMLVFLLRSVRGALIGIVCATLATGATMGIMGHLNVSLNLMTSVLPAMLWVLTLANPIHIIRRHQHEIETIPDARQALTRALKATALPCVLSSLTTAAGFVSLTAATLAPVREFGGFAALGFVLSLAITLTITPSLILLLGAPRRPWHALGLTDRVFRCLHVTYQRPIIIVMVAVVFSVLAGACIPFIDVDSNPLTFLDEDSEIIEAYRNIGDGLTGVYSLEIVVETPEGWLDPNAWSELERVGNGLAFAPGVTRVLSPLDILKKVNQWDHEFAPEAYALPETKARAEAILQELGEAERAFIDQQVSPDGRTVRLSVLAFKMGNSGLFRILDAAEHELAQLPDTYRAYTTGLVLHLVQSQEKLVSAQIRTIAIAFLVVFCCLFVGLRSMPLTLLSIPPNLFPILAALGAMALTGIRLDVATVMTASVTLGIAVDDTVHMLTAYRRNRRAGKGVHESWDVTLETVGPAILVTTLTACAAFAMLSFSDFVPLRHFGQLACFAIAVAFLADVLLLPAIVSVVARFGKT